MDQESFGPLTTSVHVHPGATPPKVQPNWSLFLLRLEQTALGAACTIAYNRLAYRLWSIVNPGKTFADFYVWQISQKLDKGRAHRTLGKRRFDVERAFGETPLHDRKSFAQRKPRSILEHLYQLGLRPEHRLVDYGCGSLRLGVHLIEYLAADRYFGLDVTDRFFCDGLSLIDPALRQEKRPCCQVISDESLKSLQAQRPEFVLSNAVLKHVPPDCLDAYFDAICSLAGDGTTLVIGFPASEREKQISGKSWSYSVATVERHILARLPGAQVTTTVRERQHIRKGLVLENTILAVRAVEASSLAESRVQNPMAYWALIPRVCISSPDLRKKR